MGPIRLQVLEEDAADAREMLMAQAIVAPEDE
jgi:hypothetical protein